MFSPEVIQAVGVVRDMGRRRYEDTRRVDNYKAQALKEIAMRLNAEEEVYDLRQRVNDLTGIKELQEETIRNLRIKYGEVVG
jgi:low affinity Fe/Cu permease